MSNIVLIGMPGCGKSTVGVLLAKALGMAFVDTDVVFQAKEGRKLQRIIEEIGIDAFLAREEEAILSLSCDKTVIATGGSVVYGRRAMKHLHEDGVVIYIRLPYQEIERRLSNLATRGVTLREMAPFRGSGVGSMLVTLLKNEVLEQGRLPYYGTALSHVLSQRVALRAGFLPAWAELTTRKKTKESGND